MAKYLQVAADARKQIEKIVSTHAFGATDDVKAELVKELAYLYNLGIRTSPRPTQSTVRLNAVKAATTGFPVRCSMQQVQPDNPCYKPYNKLVIETHVPTGSTD